MRTPNDIERFKFARDGFKRRRNFDGTVCEVIDHVWTDPLQPSFHTFKGVDRFDAAFHVQPEGFAERQCIVDVFGVVFAD